MKLIDNYNISCKLQLMGAIAGSVTMVLYPAIAEAESSQAAEENLPVIDLKPSQLPSLELKQEPILSFNPGLVPSLNQNDLSTTIGLRQRSSFNINDGQFPRVDLRSDQVPRLNWKRESIVSFNSTLTPSPVQQTEPSSDIALAPVVNLSKGLLPSFALLPGQLPQLNSPKALLANLDLKRQQRVSLNSVNTEARETIPIDLWSRYAIDLWSRYANAPSQSPTEMAIAASIDFQQGQLLPEFAVNRELPQIDLTNDKLDNLQLRSQQRVSLNPTVNPQARETIPNAPSRSSTEITIASSINFQQGELPEFAVNRELPQIDLTNDKLNNLELRTPQRVSFNSINHEARENIPKAETKLDQEIAYAPGIDIQVGDLPNFEVNGEFPKIDLSNDKLDNLELRTPQRVSFNSINHEARETIPKAETKLDQEIAYAPGIDIQVGDLPNFEVNGEFPKIDLSNDKLDNLELRTPQRVSFNSI
ncbi:MAG: hypothetical protein F6K55_42595, partial [Moorea sp. SIO4A3]|nr:hypothetical protein [Moorena sp. SIO4A3]